MIPTTTAKGYRAGAAFWQSKAIEAIGTAAQERAAIYARLAIANAQLATSAELRKLRKKG